MCTLTRITVWVIYYPRQGDVRSAEISPLFSSHPGEVRRLSASNGFFNILVKTRRLRAVMARIGRHRRAVSGGFHAPRICSGIVVTAFQTMTAVSAAVLARLVGRRRAAAVSNRSRVSETLRRVGERILNVDGDVGAGR